MNKHNARGFNSTPLLPLKNFYFFVHSTPRNVGKTCFVNYWTKKVIKKGTKKGLILHDLDYFDKCFLKVIGLSQVFHPLKIA